MITTENKMDSEVDYNTQGHYTQIRNTGAHKAAEDEHNNYSVIDRAIVHNKRVCCIVPDPPYLQGEGPGIVACWVQHDELLLSEWAHLMMPVCMCVCVCVRVCGSLVA